MSYIYIKTGYCGLECSILWVQGLGTILLVSSKKTGTILVRIREGLWSAQ